MKGWLSSGWSAGERSEPERKTDDNGQEIGYVTLSFTSRDKEVRTNNRVCPLTTEQGNRQEVFWTRLDNAVRQSVAGFARKAMELPPTRGLEQARRLQTWLPQRLLQSLVDHAARDAEFGREDLPDTTAVFER